MRVMLMHKLAEDNIEDYVPHHPPPSTGESRCC
jgi:hypothetical protein